MNLFATKKHIVLLLLLSLLGNFYVEQPLFAQNKKNLENKKKQLEREIEYTNQLLNETKNNKKLSLNQLVILNKKISIRQELIATINNEITTLSHQISNNKTFITALQSDLKKLKQEYAQMIYYAYKNQDVYSRLMFVFAAKDFNQGFLRMKYMQQYTDYRHKQATLITQTENTLNNKVQQLEEKKINKNQLLGSEQTEKQHLTNEKTEQQGVLSQLQQKESLLKKELEKKKKDAERLQQTIQNIIEAEIQKAKDKAKHDNKPEPKGLVLTHEAQQLSNTFATNKGKLPWPVLQGTITEKFGIHPHPLMQEINISNNGINIATSKGALARAVFEGEVTGVASIPAAGKVIIIRHGDFLSVYANLNEVYVKTGDKISTKQNIGSLLYNIENAKTELHLEIWKGQLKLDPEIWLYK